VGPDVISHDGFTFELPHSAAKKFKLPPAWWHVDQTPTAGVMDEGLKYLQMSVALSRAAGFALWRLALTGLTGLNHIPVVVISTTNAVLNRLTF
jgi:hypothetical protein